jgi:nicotinate-nucleotide adenylyltransferase
MKIGIFGGTFDPIHKEHINICLSAKNEYALDRVMVLPAGIPPHKNTEFLSASPAQRFDMAKTAFEGFDGITVSDFEIKNGLSYTFDTLRAFKELYPSDDIYLILGADSIIDFEKWFNPPGILKLCTVIVCGREGYEGFEAAAENLKQKYEARLLYCSYKGSAISSTALKVFLEFGVDCSQYLTPETLRYIGENGLYKKYSFYTEKLKTMLSEKRFLHTVNTVITALKLARRLGCDEEKTFLAAALHDCTKKLSDEKLLAFGFVLNSPVPEPVAHSLSGSFVARTVFNIKDKDILNSIRYHTTGRPGMSLLEKVIYVADCIEATRDFEGVETLRKIVDQDFEKGFLACMEMTIAQLKTKKKEEVSDMTLKAYKYYKQNK